MKRDIEAEVQEHLSFIFMKIGIDRPANFEQIVGFICEDIECSADPDEWHSGDIEIGFRRFLEREV